MNTTIIGLTARQLLGQRRTLLIGLLAVIPVVFAIIYRFNSEQVDPLHWVANILFIRVLIGAVLPFVALIFGTAAMGAEFEDGTAVYLLAKPIPRWRIVASKLLVAWAATSVLVIVSSLISAPIVLQGSGVGGAGLVTSFVIAEVLAAFVYCAIFFALSIFTAHALIAGLIYVFIWEGVLTNLFSGLRLLSIREYTLSLAHALGGISDRVFDAHLGGIESFVLMAIVSVAAVTLAVRWLTHWQIGETA